MLYLTSVKVICKPLFFAALLLAAPYSLAANTEVNTSIKSNLYAYQTERAESPDEENYAISVEPRITGIFDSKKLDAALVVSHTLVEQKQKQEGADKNFTDFKLNTDLYLIDKVLTFSTSASQSYRDTDQAGDLFADKILSTGDLAKVTQYFALLNFATPNPTYLGMDWQTSYAKTIADKTIDNTNKLNSNNLSITSRIYDGKSFDNLSFELSGAYNNTEQRVSNDFDSLILNGNIKVPLVNKLDVVLLGSKEQYNIDLNGQNINRTNLDTTSYGAGLIWESSANRTVQLSYNRLEESNNITSYLGLVLNWVFSPRTSVNFNYGKRFYGDSYGLKFDYNLKSLRTSLSYTESVTSFARYGTNNTLSLFVCSLGSLDLQDCFQPDSLEYVLQPGEEFRGYEEVSLNISEDVFISKSASYAIGYQKKRLKMALDFKFQSSEYIETNLIEQFITVIYNINYKLARRTTLSLNTSASRRIYDKPDVTKNTEDLLSFTLTGTRDISENIVVDLSMRYLDRRSYVEFRDASDKRITLGLTYKF